jgi:hypothetical protein
MTMRIAIWEAYLRHIPLPHPRLFSEVPFWNSAIYGILYGIDLILNNSAKFFTVQYRKILRNSVFFRVYRIYQMNLSVKKLMKSTKGMVFAMESHKDL